MKKRVICAIVVICVLLANFVSILYLYSALEQQARLQGYLDAVTMLRLMDSRYFD